MKDALEVKSPFTLRVLALTLWGEARGEGLKGMVAVAWVIRNRVLQGGWWGKTVTDVCLHPAQFSCWNASDPNRSQMDRVDTDDPHYVRALGVAALVATGDLPDPTHGATHYLRSELLATTPWTRDMLRTALVGSHTFLKEQ